MPSAAMTNAQGSQLRNFRTVDVDQSILGRMLDYGTVHVIGTGGVQNAANADVVRGIEHLHRVASPLALRSAITAK